MRIQELEIDRFGVWKDVTLPFHAPGVTVLYGPNEAGKSTLMRFIRGVLYGYQPADELDASRSQEKIICSGTMKVAHRGQVYRMRRTSESGTRGRLEINGQRVNQQDPLMQELVGAASESLFKDVFAIGLTELQQLATLTGDEVADQIYGLSLGREGEQIVRAKNAFHSVEKRLAEPEQRKGELFSLMQQLAELDRELERVGQPAQRHNRLIDQISKYENKVIELRQQQKNLQHDLRGYQFLNRVWEPWTQEQKLRRQLDRLPSTHLDLEILNRFDEMELELSEIDSQRKQLIEEAKRLQKQAEEIRLRPELEEETCAIQNLHEQIPAMQRLEAELHARSSAADPRSLEIQRHLGAMDGHWDLKRLNNTDVSPASMHSLLQLGATFRNASRSRAKAAKRYKQLNAKLKQLEQDSFGRQHGAQSIEQTRTEILERISELEDLKGLRLRKQHLQKMLRMLPETQEVEAVEQELPPFFYWVLWFFAVAGGILFLSGSYSAVHGLVAGGSSAAIIGACYSLLGLTSLGLCWTMKQHFSKQEIQWSGFDKDREKVEREMAEVDGQIHRIQSRQLLHPQRTAPQPRTLAAEQHEQKFLDDRLNELREELRKLDHTPDRLGEVETLRRRLSQLRDQLQKHQSKVGRTRRDWLEGLRKLGIAETLKVSVAIDQCQKIADTKQAIILWEQTHPSLEQQQKQLDTFLERVRLLSERIEGRGIAVRDPYQLLADWHRELQLLGERRRERTQLRSTAKEKRREAAKLVDKVERMRDQRSVLLTQLGVSDRGEIAAKLAAIDERKTLEQKYANAQAELDKVMESEPELVITEDLLDEYEEQANREQIAEIQDQLQLIDEELQEEYQKIGRSKQELREIEEDRSVASIRFDRQQVLEAIREASESLIAHRVADHALEQLRERIESDRQPQTLQTASDYLDRLTCGKYQNIWTPLGEKILLVDDDAEQSFRVEQLSSGTREQVFLSLRLAMIKDFASQGIELPMILDDVTVNFDQVRTEAAVQTLLNVAEGGQQIMLFTCHLHLAHLFENEGVDPVWLPTHRPEMSV